MADPDRFAVLNDEERRIAGLLIEGLNTSEIAKRLTLPYRTVADTAKALRDRLGVKDLAELRTLADKFPQ